jgi:hypothetical protein
LPPPSRLCKNGWMGAWGGRRLTGVRVPWDQCVGEAGHGKVRRRGMARRSGALLYRRVGGGGGFFRRAPENFRADVQYGTFDRGTLRPPRPQVDGFRPKFSRRPRRRTLTPTHPLAPRRRTPTPRPRGSEGRVVVLVGPGLWISPLGLRIVGQMAYFPTCDSSDRARVQSPPCDGPPTNQPEEDAECLRAG